jgi:hypothetical protein
MSAASRSERGSTIPLILGFFLVALLVVAGSVAASDAFVQQRDLQSLCDGAALDAASAAADLSRSDDPGSGGALRFAAVELAVQAYLARDPDRREVQITATLSADARTLTLRCELRESIAFGAMFGKSDGVRHVAVSAARAPVSD